LLDYYRKRNFNDQTDSCKNIDRQSQVQKELTPPSSRKVSDDVFIAPDTLVSNEDDNYQQINNKEETTTMIRQKSRNWADCPIDDSVVDITPPSSVNNIVTSDDVDDFQVGNFILLRINLNRILYRLFEIKLQNLV
jgi:hypothetical protein